MYLQSEIEAWAEERGLFKQPSFSKQMQGVAGEAIEAQDAYSLVKVNCAPKSDLEKELGDIYVFWMNACKIADIKPEDAALAAYNKISNRKGYIVEGRFIKDV